MADPLADLMAVQRVLMTAAYSVEWWAVLLASMMVDQSADMTAAMSEDYLVVLRVESTAVRKALPKAGRTVGWRVDSRALMTADWWADSTAAR